MPLPNEINDDFIEGVYNGDITPFNPPTSVYSYTANALDSMFWGGYGEVSEGQNILSRKAVAYRQNLSMFSGAKTCQNTIDLTAYVFDEDGKKRAFSQFKQKAFEINDLYNTTWLKTEQDSSFIQAQNARKIHRFEAEKEVFPVLEYLTVGDQRVRPSHKKLDGLRARVDDPIWRRIMPQNDWRCRCIVIQSNEYDVTPKKTVKTKTDEIFKDFKKNPAFDMNVYYDEVIFKEFGRGKASYFNLPKELKSEQKDNFGFPSMSEVTGKYVLL